MIDTIDSFRIKAHPELIHDVSYNRFDRVTRKEGEGKQYTIDSTPDRYKVDKYTVTNPAPGIKAIEIDNRTGDLFIEGSAKILREQYNTGITARTVERAIQAFNDTGIITLDVPGIIQHGEVLRCDVAKNMQVEAPVSDYIRALSMLPVKDRYDVTPYPGESVVFTGRQKEDRERMIFYNKIADTTKKDRELLQYLPGPYLLRAEINLRSGKRLKQYTKARTLQGILNGETAPLLHLFNRIRAGVDYRVYELFQDYEGLGYVETKDRIGYEGILAKCNGDLETVWKFIRQKTQGNISRARYLRPYREILMQQNMRGPGYGNRAVDLINEITLMLAV